MNDVAQVMQAMIRYNAGDVRRINHLLKVYGLARTIGELEELDAQTLYTLEIAALTHDIGIRISEAKYGSSAGSYQQQEGPPEARKLLAGLAVEPDVIERVCWLIAHHHTYGDIREIDYQILVEADFLVNIDEDKMTPDAVDRLRINIFRTKTGIAILDFLYAGRPG